MSAEDRVNTCIMFAFGDSITYGMWEERGGWTERLRTRVAQKNIADENFRCLLYNMGIPGDTAEGVNERMDRELRTRVRDDFETVIVIAIGLNDAATEHNKQRYSLKSFEENIEALIKIGKRYTSRILLVGLNPVDESKVNPIPSNPDLAYQNSQIMIFNDALRIIGQAEGLYFVDIWKHWNEQDYRDLLFDGLHPNEKGHALNAALVGGCLSQFIALE